jgi:hypothetical protein
LPNLGINGKIILKFLVKKWDMNVLYGFGTGTDSCGEPLWFLKETGNIWIGSTAVSF